MANYTIDHTTDRTANENSTTLVNQATAQTSELEYIKQNTNTLKLLLEQQIITNELLKLILT